MPKRNHLTNVFSTPSPGRILRDQKRNGRIHEPTACPAAADAIRASPLSSATETSASKGAWASAVALPCNPFRPNCHADALAERGVMLAPLLVRWHYRLTEATSFAQWLKRHEIILADARLVLTPETAAVHYYGTYIAQPPTGPRVRDNERTGDAASADDLFASPGPAAETLWGFSSESALNHFYNLCSGRVARLSIVDEDLRTFVAGLKSHVHEAGDAHFRQTVLLAAAVHGRERKAAGATEDGPRRER